MFTKKIMKLLNYKKADSKNLVKIKDSIMFHKKCTLMISIAFPKMLLKLNVDASDNSP